MKIQSDQPKAIMDIDFEAMNSALKRVKDGLEKLPDQRLSDDETSLLKYDTPELRAAALETYGCNCPQCCSAYMVAHAPPVTYVTRQNDRLDEIERLTGQVLQLQGRLDAIRAEWHMVHATCPVPVFVRDWFKGLGLLIEGGE